MNFFHWLTLVFITLKLTNYIDWSWFWVWSPFPALVIFKILTSEKTLIWCFDKYEYWRMQRRRKKRKG